MITENATGLKAFTATAVAIEAYTRVVLGSGGTISVAGATSLGIGFTTAACAASGIVNVRLIDGGTVLCQAASAIAAGHLLYGATAGEVAKTGLYPLRMIALDEATAQGDVIECAYLPAQSTGLQDYAAANIGTVAAAGNDQAGATAISKTLTYVTGADNTKGVKLPTAVAGLVFEVYNVEAATTVKVYPATGDKLNTGTVNVHLTLAASGYARFTATDDEIWAAYGNLT